MDCKLTSHLKLFPEFTLKWLVDEFNRNLPKELDFVSEANNAMKVAGYFKDNPDVAVPQIHWNLTTPKVLTMEWVNGCKATDIARMKSMGIDPNRVIISEVELQQIDCM
jgi:aarF domain-containing kinase